MSITTKKSFTKDFTKIEREKKAKKKKEQKLALPVPKAGKATEVNLCFSHISRTDKTLFLISAGRKLPTTCMISLHSSIPDEVTISVS